MANRLQVILEAIWTGGRSVDQASKSFSQLSAAGKRTALELAAVEQRSQLISAKMNELARDVARGAKSFDDAEKELKEFEGTLADLDTDTKQTGGAFGSLSGALGKAALAFGAVAAAAVTAQRALDFAEQGAALRQLELSFNRLNDSVLQTPTLLEDLNRAARGTIREADLMAGVLKLTAGASEDVAQSFAQAAPQLLEIAKAAQALNPQLGDTAFLYDSITTGIKRNSPLILDNLGIVVKIGEANEEYAAALGKTVEELSAEERQMALLNGVLETGNTLIQQAGGSAESLTDPYAKLRIQTQGLVDDTKLFVLDALTPLVRLLTDDYGDAIDAAIRANLDFEASLTQLENKAKQLQRDKTFVTFIKGQNDEIQAVQAELIVAIGEQSNSFEQFNDSLVEGFGSSFAAWENFIEGIQNTQTALDIGELRILGTDELFELIQAAEAANVEFTEFVNVLAELSRTGAPVEEIDEFARALNEATAADEALINSIKNLNPEFGQASQATQELSADFLEIVRQFEEGERGADDFSRRLAQLGQGVGIRRVTGELADFNRETEEAIALQRAFRNVLNDSSSALGRMENNLSRTQAAMDGLRNTDAIEELTGVAGAVDGVAGRVEDFFEGVRKASEEAEQAAQEALQAQERYWNAIDGLVEGAVGQQFDLIDSIAESRAEIAELRDAVAADPGNIELVNELESALDRFDELTSQAGESWNELVIDIITQTGGFDQVAADFAVAAGIMTQAQADARLQAVQLGDAIRNIGLAVDAGAISTQEGAQLFAGIQDGSVTIEEALAQLDQLLQGAVLPSLGDAGQQLEGLPTGVTFDFTDISNASGAASSLGGELETVTASPWFVQVDATAIEAATTQAGLLFDELTAITSETWVIDVELNQQGGSGALTPLQGAGFASGTDGWQTIPGGYPNDSYGPLYFSSGELLNVVPAGGQAPGGGGGVTSVDNRRTLIVANGREAMALALSQAGEGRRRTRNAYMGVGR